MDSLISAAARALAIGDALGALQHVALREDPPALALRGIAMAQLGEHGLARGLLRRAARGFGAREELARARCIVAEAEVALAERDFAGSPRALNSALATLEAHADHANAWQARLVAARKLLLLGQLQQAGTMLALLPADGLPPLAALAALLKAELDLRSWRIPAARTAFAQAREAAARSGIAALSAEVEEARTALEQPAARRLAPWGEQALRIDEVAALHASDALVIDACRHSLGAGAARQSLARRPVLFALAQALAAAWPGDVTREALIERAFRTRAPDETHRARLRVEIGRLRALAKGLARIDATPQGFVLKPEDGRKSDR
ncbi:helix-turn-helix domain-containing protein, partial [Herbaspirillum sp.]|uniref:helix-turn-helix domain-containing protein n=1 Tax=Herbaspirillum sp. TaxID=1890675 RepID=UPI0031E23E36